jgi:hypothetical protein
MSGLRYQMYALIEASYVGTFLRASVRIRRGPRRQIEVPRVIKVTYLGELAVGEPPNYLLLVLVPRALHRKKKPPTHLTEGITSIYPHISPLTSISCRYN